MKRIALLFLAAFAVVTAHATVTTQTISVGYTCTGSIGPYPFTFSISAATSLTVKQNGTTLSPSAYIIVPVNNNYDNGGRVTLITACPNGQPLVLTRITPINQTTQFNENMPSPMKAIENGLDKLTEIAQELGANGGTGSGSVSNVSVATANGFQGTVTNPNTTPIIAVTVDSTHVLPTNTGNGAAYLNSSGTYTIPTSGGGGTPAGATLSLQFNNAGAFGGVQGLLTDTTQKPLFATGSDYVQPATAASYYPKQFPYNFNQNVVRRYGYNDFVSAFNLNVNAASGASSWLHSGGLGNFMNMAFMSVSGNVQTGYQLGGDLSFYVNHFGIHDHVMNTWNTTSAGCGNAFGECFEDKRLFMSFNQVPFGGTLALLGNDARGNPKVQVTAVTGTAISTSAEERTIYNRSKGWTSPGNMLSHQPWSTDGLFLMVTGDASSGVTARFGASTYTTVIGGSDNQKYNASCPSTVIGSWGATDPYAPTAVDGSGTSTTAQCVQVASTTGMSAGTVLMFSHGGMNWEYTTVQSVPAVGYIVVNLKRAHDPGDYVSFGGGVGYCFQDGNNANASCYPIMATLSGDRMLLYTNAETTVSLAELKTSLYNGSTMATPKTITLAVTGGVPSIASQNAAVFSATVYPGASNGIFPVPLVTLTGTGSCGVAPTFTWTFAAQRYYVAALVGGSGCPSDLAATVQSVFPNPFKVFPVTRLQLTINPTLDASYKADIAAGNTAPYMQNGQLTYPASTSGYAVLDSFASGSGQWVAGDTIIQAPHPNQYMYSQTHMDANSLSSRSGKTGPLTIETYSGTGFGQAFKQWVNTDSASKYIGRQRNNWLPGNPSLALCSLTPNGTTPCYDPLDGQFLIAPALRIGGLTGGLHFDFAPVNGAAVVDVGCGDGLGGYVTAARCQASTPIYDAYPMLRSTSGLTPNAPTTLNIDTATNNWSFALNGGILNTSGTFHALVLDTPTLTGVLSYGVGPTGSLTGTANGASTDIRLNPGGTGSLGSIYLGPSGSSLDQYGNLTLTTSGILTFPAGIKVTGGATSELSIARSDGTCANVQLGGDDGIRPRITCTGTGLSLGNNSGNLPWIASDITATGVLDGHAPVTVSAATTGTVGSTQFSGFIFLGTGAAAASRTLPIPVVGAQYCVANDTGVTSVITIQTAGTGQFIDVQGALTASGGYVTSAGALGDASCFLAKSTTVWKLFQQSGTWVAH